MTSLLLNVTPTARLANGTGWSGATSTPASQGNPAAQGYPETPMSRWDTVPYQTFAGLLQIGLVAFHMEGINNVQFSVNNGPWFIASAMIFNGHTQVTEYTAILKASDYTDGLIEIRAKVLPVNGVPVVMQGSSGYWQSLYLYANSGGTYNPVTIYQNSSTGNNTNNGLTTGTAVQTIDKALDLVPSGGIVNIMLAGTYTLNPQTPTSNRWANGPFNYAQWTTLQGDPSLAKSSVILNGNVRTLLNHTRLHNLTYDTHSNSVNTESGYMVWADNILFTNSLGWTDTGPTDGPLRSAATSGIFYTDCTFNNTQWGPLNSTIARNIKLTQMSADFLDGQMGLGANIKAAYGRGVDIGTHNDCAQSFGATRNQIIYNYTVTDVQSFQDIFHDKDSYSSFQDVAYVNVSIWNSIVGSFDGYTQFASTNQHIYFKNVSVPNQTWLWRTDLVPAGGGQNVPYSGTNFVLDGVTVNSTTYSALATPVPGVTVRSRTNSGY